MAKMSEAENVVMGIIWKEQKALTPNEVLEKLPEQYTWKYKTVATFLTRLVEKGFLTCEKTGKSHRYSAKIKQEEYLKDITKSFLNQFHFGSVSHLVATLYDDKIENNKLNELLDYIDKGE